MPSLSRLYAELTPDPHRRELGWSEDFEAAQLSLLAEGDDGQRRKILGDWLGKHQPCLFGKIAARGGLIQYCFLTQRDLENSDEVVAEKIKAAGLTWRKEGYNGRKHAFIVHAVAQPLAQACPDQRLLAFAKRLGELYLLESDLKVDEIYLDDLFLRIPGMEDDHIWRWRAGVNVFASAGDKRWWHRGLAQARG